MDTNITAVSFIGAVDSNAVQELALSTSRSVHFKTIAGLTVEFYNDSQMAQSASELYDGLAFDMGGNTFNRIRLTNPTGSSINYSLCVSSGIVGFFP